MLITPNHKLSGHIAMNFGIADHPKAERLFTMAWEDGHSEGYEAVYSRAEDLSELMV